MEADDFGVINIGAGVLLAVMVVDSFIEEVHFRLKAHVVA